MTDAIERMPRHAPYDVEIGEPVEVRAFTRESDGFIICEFTFREDKFGGSLDPSGLDNLNLTLEVDKLVGGIAGLVWNEMYGTPVFRDEDEEFVGRVSAQKPWEATPRRSTQGWVKRAPADLPDESEPTPRDEIAASIGDADVSDLRLKQDEMAALMRGEIPEGLTERLLKARSTLNLLDSIAEVLDEAAAESADLDRARRELHEVRARFERT